MASKVNPNSQFAQSLALLNGQKSPAGTQKAAKLSVILEESAEAPKKKKGKKLRSKGSEKPQDSTPQESNPSVRRGNISSIKDLIGKGPVEALPVEQEPQTSEEDEPEETVVMELPVDASIASQTASVIWKYELPIQQNKRCRIALLVTGLLLAIGVTITIGMLTNFKFSDLKDWQWDMIGIGGAIVITLFIVALLRRSSPNTFKIGKESIAKETTQKAAKKPDINERYPTVRVKPGDRSALANHGICQNVNPGQTA